jgi:hypothetical protein
MTKHSVSGSIRAIAGIAALLFAAFGFSTQAYADDPAVVRLSFVDGSVQVGQGGAAPLDKAVANMPLFEGSTVTTATDGQAEIEFADGSVARLTPNSSLELTHLQRLGPTGHTDLTLTSGLAYFELNVGQGQHFSVKMGPATLHPIENTVFRVGLDNTPEVAVMQGSLHADGNGLDTDVMANQDFRINLADPSQSTLAQSIPPDTWDQWNADRDTMIAQLSANQTDVRDDSQAAADPGWNDLDYYGNWYPVEGYGNVWTPSDVGSDWDPFGYGYWGSFAGYGTTWISGYPWGWLPYHCGAWNYFPFGWGWVPGGCGLGWSPVVTVWNLPPGYRLPVWPRGGVIVPSQHRFNFGNHLIAVDRGAAARGPWGPGQSGMSILRNRGMQGAATRGQPLQVEGSTIQPLPVVSRGTLGFQGGPQGGQGIGGSPIHVGVPVDGAVLRPGYQGTRNNVERGIGVPAVSPGQPRPVGRPAYAPAPRSAPSPPPAPHISAPPPPAHH